MISQFLVNFISNISILHFSYTSWQVHEASLTPLLVVITLTSLFIFILSSVI